MPSNDMMKQKLKQGLGFGILQAHKPRDELAVEEEAALSGNRVDPDNRVYCLDWIFPHEAADSADVVYHRGRGVHGGDLV